jgi:hypothetical protein
MVALPTPVAVAMPEALIVDMEALLDAQETWFVMS